MSTEGDRNACREGSLYLACGKTWRLIQDIFYKSETSSRVPNFDASNAWQMGHNSREGFFSWARTALALFAAWIHLTSNADNMITIYQLPSKFQNTFDLLKHVQLDDLWVYQGFMMLLSHQAGIQGTLKQCLRYYFQDRALIQHITLLFDGISFDTRSIHVLCFTSQ